MKAHARGFPWVGAFLLAVPGFGLAVAGGILGLDQALGIGALLVGVLYIIVDLLLLQPRLEAKAQGAGRADKAAQEFLELATGLDTVDGVAQEFGRAVTRGLGNTRSILLAPGADGGLRVLVASGPAPTVEVGDPTAAFLWLGDCAEPLSRARLVELQEFDGARETLALCDALDCDVLLPLLHRGLLLGLGLLKVPAAASRRDLSGFYSAMRAYMTVAVANTFLDAETRDRGQLTKSFDLAMTMQESLMPDERPVQRDGFELRGLFLPVAECGGDLWSWRELTDGKVMLLIADATGHGAAPALLAAVAKGAIDAHWQMSLQHMDPALLLTALNTAVFRAGRKRYMMTAFAAVVDTTTGELSFANAGQNFPYFISASGHGAQRVEPLIARGNSLGATAVAHFETHTRPMGAGDKLVLFTDGITEVGSPMVEWGERRFRAALAANADQRATRIPEIIMGEIERFLDGREAVDDITMICFEFGHGGDQA